MSLQKNILYNIKLAILTIVLMLVVLVTCSAKACEGGYFELGVGHNTNLTGSSVPWQNGGGVGGMFSIGYISKLSPKQALVYNWSHYSQYNVGPPLNDTDESSVDHFGVKWLLLFR